MEGAPRVVRQVSGGARLLAGDERMSSARAETAGLASVLIVLSWLLKEGYKIRCHVDNQSVVHKYVSGGHLRGGRDWARVPNRDLWEAICRVLSWTDSWDRVRVEKVKAHRDTEKGADGEMVHPSKISLHEHGNILADKVVHLNQGAPLIASVEHGSWEGGGDGQRWTPAQASLGWGDYRCVGEVGKGVMEHVKLQRFQRRLETSDSRELAGKEAEWMGSREWAFAQLLNGAKYGPRSAARHVQMSHGLLPTRVQLARRECCDSSEAARCLYCGQEETQWHAVGCCAHPGTCRARDLGETRMQTLISEAPTAMHTRDVLSYVYWVRNGRWDREGAAEPEWETGEGRGRADAQLKRAVEVLGGEQIWRGRWSVGCMEGLRRPACRSEMQPPFCGGWQRKRGKRVVRYGKQGVSGFKPRRPGCSFATGGGKACAAWLAGGALGT